MIRNLKALGLALVAVFAMSAIAASAASAATPGEFTSTGNVTVTGTGTETFTFEAGQFVTCTGHHTIMNQNATPWGFFNPGAGLTTLTDQAHYTACTAHVGVQSLPATVTTNGCDFLLHIGETKVGTTEYEGTADVVCGVNETIEIHVYEKSPDVTSICTYKVPAQTGLKSEKGLIKNNAGKIEVKGNVLGITSSRTGVLCGGPKETKAAVQEANTTASGTNEAKEATSISVTD
jgi:hypothetical protein